MVLTALGDPIDASTGDYGNDGTDGDFARRIGDHGDALMFFPYPKGSGSSSGGLLVQNHEALTDINLHASGRVSRASTVATSAPDRHAHPHYRNITYRATQRPCVARGCPGALASAPSRARRVNETRRATPLRRRVCPSRLGRRPAGSRWKGGRQSKGSMWQTLLR